MISKYNQPEDTAELRKRAQEIAREKEAWSIENLETLSHEEIRQLIHELQVHQIELEMQNEELRTAQADLDAARDRYFDLYDLAPVGYCTLSEKGLILEANLTAATLMGMVMGDLVKQPITRFIHKGYQDTYYLHSKKLIESGRSQSFELRMVNNDGISIWVNLTITLAQNADGATAYRVVISDITQSKEADEKLRQSELYNLFLLERNAHLMSLFVEHSPAAIAMLDNEMKYILVSRRFHTDYVLGEQNIIGRSHYDVFPEIPERWREIHRRCLAGAIEKSDGEPFLRANGRTDWVRWEIRPWYESPEQIGGIILFSEVITDRKMMEKALKESEQRFRETLENVQLISVLLDAEGRVTFCNDFLLQLTGYRREEVIGIDWFSTFVPEARPDVEGAFLKGIHTGHITPFIENPICKKDGTERLIRFSNTLLRNAEGQPIGATSIGEDITERKLAEEETNRTKLLLRYSLESQKDTILLSIDRNYRYLYFNKTHLDSMKIAYNKDVELGMNILECITSDADRLAARENYDRALKGESHSNVRIFGDIEKVYYESFFNPILNDRNEIIGATALARNITDRIRVKEALINSEEKFRKAFYMSPDAVNINRLEDGMYISINPGFTRIMGYTEDDIAGKTSIELNIWVDIKDRQKLVAGLKKDGEVANLEAFFRKKSGDIGFGLMSASVIELNGEPHILSITREITERKLAENQINRQMAFTQCVLDTIDAHIAILDGTDTICAVNSAWRQFALSNHADRDESKWGVGACYYRSCDSQDGDTQYAKEAFDGIRMVKSGRSKTFEIVYSCDSPEEQRWFFMRVLPMADFPDHVVVSHTNITSLKQTEDKLRLLTSRLLSVQENERKRISIELHDQLGSDLMTLMLTIRFLQKELGAKQARFKQLCDETISQIDAMAANVKRMARDMSPSILEDLGLTAALRGLSNEMVRFLQIEIQSDIDDIDEFVDREQHIQIFRIFQEALTNIRKHAKTKKIFLSAKRADGSILCMIQDFGMGFDAGQLEKKNALEKGMGLATMAERAQILGARLQIDSAIGMGTNILLNIPVIKR